RLASRVQVDELIALLPRVLAHELMPNPLLGEDKSDLARKWAQRELEQLPHRVPALALRRAASSAWDSRAAAYLRPLARATSAPVQDPASSREAHKRAL